MRRFCGCRLFACPLRPLFRDDPILNYVFALVAIAPIVAAIIAYFLFLFRDPNRLQSEEFVLRHHAQQSILTKGGTPEIIENEPPLLSIEPKPLEDDL